MLMKKKFNEVSVLFVPIKLINLSNQSNLTRNPMIVQVFE